jgi:hypothetical protein
MRRLRDFWLGDADIAPVAAFRIVFGLLLFNWSWQLYPDLDAFFADDGILPRSQLGAYDDRLSLLNVSGDATFVAIVWGVLCVVALLLALGWHTRLQCLLAFVLVSSFSWRDPLILDGSDLVFRLVPLWLGFTAAGERWSLDARRSGGPVTNAWALPIRILELQIAWIYLATGLEKLGGIDWILGTAAYYALQLEHTFARSWAHPVALDPTLSLVISWYTLAVELAFLPLAMLPFRATRLVAALGAAALQLGILALMNVGNFPLVMLAGCLLFLPAGAIVRVMRGGSLETSSPPHRRPFAAGALLAVAAAAAFLTAVPSWADLFRPHGDAAALLASLSIDQRWDMFSPNPSRSDGWLLAPGTLADGTRLDVLTGRPADDRSERYSDPLYARWTKVHERIASAFYAGYRSSYARHLCLARNSHLAPGQSPLVSVELIYVERTIQAPEKGPPLISETSLWSQQC